MFVHFWNLAVKISKVDLDNIFHQLEWENPWDRFCAITQRIALINIFTINVWVMALHQIISVWMLGFYQYKLGPFVLMAYQPLLVI